MLIQMFMWILEADYRHYQWLSSLIYLLIVERYWVDGQSAVGCQWTHNFMALGRDGEESADY